MNEVRDRTPHLVVKLGQQGQNRLNKTPPTSRIPNSSNSHKPSGPGVGVQAMGTGAGVDAFVRPHGELTTATGAHLFESGIGTRRPIPIGKGSSRT